MKISDLESYRCPISLTSLQLISNEVVDDEVISGTLASAKGDEFPIVNGIPDFTWPKALAEIDQKTRALYDKLANEYDNFADIPFQTFHQKNEDVRKAITDKLKLTKRSRVLEIGGGDGRGAEFILKELDETGRLYFQELSPSFLNSAVRRLSESKSKIAFSLANASYLSFPDNFFDAAHHFGGINTFSEIQRCMKELARVVKPGGKVVIGDEGIGPWLRSTEFGKIMINSNPLIGYEVPINLIPVEARDVKVEWIMLGAFFIIEFTVAEGEPKGNYHIPIPSERGGTHWSRFFGNLEGVSDETKELAYLAKKRTGKSMHEWLDHVVKSAAKKILNS